MRAVSRLQSLLPSLQNGEDVHAHAVVRRGWAGHELPACPRQPSQRARSVPPPRVHGWCSLHFPPHHAMASVGRGQIVARWLARSGLHPAPPGPRLPVRGAGLGRVGALQYTGVEVGPSPGSAAGHGCAGGPAGARPASAAGRRPGPVPDVADGLEPASWLGPRCWSRAQDAGPQHPPSDESLTSVSQGLYRRPSFGGLGACVGTLASEK